MNKRHKTKARLRALATEAARVDARATVLADGRERGGSAFAGHTPTTIDGHVVMHSNGIGWGMRSRESRGTTIRTGKKNSLKLVPPRYDGDAPKRGGARLAAGEWLERDASGAMRVAYTARVEPRAVREDVTPAQRAALRSVREPVTVLRGKDGAPVREDDTVGDTAADVATADYFARLRAERGEDFDPDTLEAP